MPAKQNELGEKRQTYLKIRPALCRVNEKLDPKFIDFAENLLV